MKKSFLMMVIVAITLTMFSCKKDDNTITVIENGELQLEGTWILKEINFTTKDAYWNDEIPYTSGNIHHYAPYMFIPMSGFQFLTTPIKNNDGEIISETKFNYVNNHEDAEFHPHNPEMDVWYWNYTEDHKGFTIGSVDPRGFPSYAFNIKEVSNTKLDTKNDILTFDAVVASRIPGEGMNDSQDLPVEITLQRGEPGEDIPVKILGESFVQRP